MNRPKEWKEGTLDDLCELKQDTCLPIASGSDFYIGLEHVESGRFSIRSNGKPDQVISAKSRFEANNVLYGKLRPYLDKAAVADKNGICSTDILVLSPKDGTPPLYLAGLLHSDRFIQHAIQTTHGVNHPRTSWKSIKDFRTIIPPLPEQRKIAAVLFRIQKAIELQEAIIERTRELKKATMQFVFTHGLRGEKTKETEIGRMPESWAVVRVGDSLEKVRFDRDKQIPASEYKASGKYRIVDQGQSLVTGYTDDDSRLINENLPLIVFGDHTRSLKLVDFPFALGGDGTKLLKPVSGFDCQFFFFALTAIDIPSRGYNRHFPLLANSCIPKPDKNEQEEIAHIFSTLTQKIELHTAKKSALQDLFKTTLNKLMSGEIRVKGLEIETSRSGIRA